MTHLIEQFIELLQASEKLFDQLLSIIEEEKAAMVMADAQRLVSATDGKKQILIQIQGLEQHRSRLLAQIAQQLRLPPDTARLSALAERVPGPFQARLKKLNNSLGDITAKIRAADKENRRMMHHCLHLVQNALSFLNAWTSPSAVYGASGAVHARQGNGRLLSDSA